MVEDDFLKMLEAGLTDTDSADLSDTLKKKDAKPDRLKLIIGIGGSGCSAVVKAREIASRKLKKYPLLKCRWLELRRGFWKALRKGWRRWGEE